MTEIVITFVRSTGKPVDSYGNCSHRDRLRVLDGTRVLVERRQYMDGLVSYWFHSCTGYIELSRTVLRLTKLFYLNPLNMSEISLLFEEELHHNLRTLS